MTRNKRRLQVALYARPKHPGTYHYALFVAPKNGEGPTTKHHVKNTLLIDDSGQATAPWRYEKVVIDDLESEQRLLVRVVVGKVIGTANEIQRLVGSVPVADAKELVSEASETFNCVSWVRDVYRELVTQRAVAARYADWDEVQRQAVEYVDRKREAGRWDGRWKGSGVPLMDLLEDKEIVP
ncbi:hypothetical protein B0A48_01463 [Cryoendolithus antarcticus]|uniref:Uncharacterized protein n=1 Tax=Cryoendolithus antarcticus TaxID=1507870 RepID=A0A1V8TPF5_9PEZI|nr:hypothetical protein B0A48_01463 [Cryoendolithus antarcticus]